MTAKVIDFSKRLKEQQRDKTTTQIDIMTNEDISVEVADDVIGYLLLKLTEDFVEFEPSDEYYRDLAVALHAIQSTVQRVLGEEHPFQHIADTLFTVKRTSANTVEVCSVSD